jgi:hypothetical protein|tara:strand:+ start:410 stop:667 length:258 start_codon:yes stop_codon:yes gene_type:complete
MSSPFQQAFSAKSPLHNHGDKDIAKAKKISEKDGESGDYNYSSDEVMKLKTRGEKKNAKHSKSSKQDVASNRQDEDAVMAESSKA